MFTIHWMTRLIIFLSLCFTTMACSDYKKEAILTPDDIWTANGEYKNFLMKGQAYTEKNAEASLLFHTNGESGYEVVFHNGSIDGSRKTGSLSAIRNLYRSLAEDEKWFDFQIAVRGKNIAIQINGTDVVHNTEPSTPYRTSDHTQQ